MDTFSNLPGDSFFKKYRQLSGVVMIILAFYFQLIPNQISYTLMVVVPIGKVLSYFSPKSIDIGQHFLTMFVSTSALWMLYLDPCSIYIAIWATVGNLTRVVFDHSNCFFLRLLYTSVMSISWLAASQMGLSEDYYCSQSISARLRVDTFLVLAGVIFYSLGLSKYADAHIKAVKDSLSEVKKLNVRFEAVNKELQQLLEDKDNFIFLFSHETRNPLNILLGNLGLLLDEVDTPQIKEKLVRCKFCADLLLQHLNNILDSGKLVNRGTLEVTPAPIRVYEYIRSILSFMDMLVKKKDKITARIIVPQKLPKTLRVDMQRLTQVVLNLLTNAVKFTQTGSVSLVINYLNKPYLEEADYYPSTMFGYSLLSGQSSVSSTSEFNDTILGSAMKNREEMQREISSQNEKNKVPQEPSVSTTGFLKMEINDTGCGMKEGDLAKLFQKFSQAHSEGSQRQIGTGLGLWITRKLCELMGGSIRVYSKPSVGSTFVAIVQADWLPTTKQTASVESPSSKSSLQKRAVIVGDDPFNVEFHAQVVKNFDYDQIETATSGQELVNVFKSRPEGYFDVAIVDISMPDIRGTEAACAIREFEKSERRRHKIKIGFVTEQPNLKEKLQCEEEPINALFYLTKPIRSYMLEPYLKPRVSARNSSGKSLEILGSKPLVLCVDDDVFNLDCLGEMLESLGAVVEKASSGEEGLVKLKSVILDENTSLKLILMDCRMTGMDGWTTARRMKEILAKETKLNVPIIGVTGEDKLQNQEKFKYSRMDDLLQKPVFRRDLKTLLNKCA